MIEIIDVPVQHTLDDYASYVHLRPAVKQLQEAAPSAVEKLRGRTVWMVNSTAQGGGVAEMMPKMVALLRELGVRTEWVVIGSDDERFFDLTKRLHNLIHDAGPPSLNGQDQSFYEAQSKQFAEELIDRIGPNDLLVVHDPQPMAMGALIGRRNGNPTIWRCHIGLDQETPATRAAWDFLEPWADGYNHSVFTVKDYAPSYFQDRLAVIPPAIDPLSPKNKPLPVHKISGILVNASLGTTLHPVLTLPFDEPARRLQADGSFEPAIEPEGIGLLYRPIVTQVSRWDRLKGWTYLIEGFKRLKAYRDLPHKIPSETHGRRLDLVRLVLAGPDPASIQDDPEGLEVFEQICEQWHDLPTDLQQDVAVVVLPMSSRRHNALMVNALQRCSTIVVQNSLQEGFGLTVTEAMWKDRPVMGSHAVGIREQITDQVHGRLVKEAKDPEEIAAVLNEMLMHPEKREAWARNAMAHVSEEYLVFSQVRRWLDLLSGCC
jgi:trehalose synthase